MDLIEKTRNAVIHAGTTFSEDRLRAYKRALEIEEGNDNAPLLERIKNRHGTHTIDHAEKIGLGSKKYTLISIDK